MIETTIFNTGDITEVKTWLEENAADIFTSIVVNGTNLECYIEEVKSVVLGFTADKICTLTLDNGTYKTIRGASQSNFTTAYKTSVGIWLFSLGSSYTVDVCVTKDGEIYGNSGYEGSTGARWVGIKDASSFTTMKMPTEFNVTSLSPVPYTNTKVSENLLNAIWSQLIISGRNGKPQIVSINNVNYVYDGFLCLRE